MGASRMDIGIQDMKYQPLHTKPPTTRIQPHVSCRQSYSQNHTVLYLALLWVNQWEEEKYFLLFRYWLKSKGA
jgi:hypothetical protein